ncbi:hypothetical protein BGZ94_005303 [Podila epigama]|nr:hypothetical protein BGZ94_005303 [Podila epigama]
MDGSSFAGNKLGVLSILDGGVKAQLIIGNHRLEGKVVQLAKALLLIQKEKPQKDDEEMSGVSVPTIEPTWQPGTQHYGKSTLDQKSYPSGPRISKQGHISSDDDDDDNDNGHGNGGMRKPSGRAGESPGNGQAKDSAGDFNPLAPENLLKKATFNSVAIIRQKILFNTMPVPIIHTERRGLTVIKRGV